MSNTMLHHPCCDHLEDALLPCNCDELEADDGRLSQGEVVAWAIFFTVVALFMVRILVNIYTI